MPSTKVKAMELSKVDVVAPTWRASCRCLVPTMHYGVYHAMLLVVEILIESGHQEA
jgi:hypothetical protein